MDIVKRWERDKNGRTRYYLAHLQRDLFGAWVVTRAWGRKGSRLGKMQDLPVPSMQDGLEALERIARRRARRGYALLTGHADRH